ncbi:S9 family peptidase [Capnocytophaga canis]|uniref:Putative glutamyl endopeptidase, chloroplastic n=1 Tax=Capnocytophaga canis TaxID=1848903 RepID=A0A0B7HZD2_9FLAO|nr:prolyl oligopeptidase family serine peptidase [Capnocytophaga canis]CEN43954.1 putative glutamyl endopeptidase, chloroplastic [Capnocytophaga canis]
MRKILSLILVSSMSYLTAQENLTYQKPSEEILQLADFERAPSVMMNSQRTWMVFSYRSTYRNLEELNQEEIRLGGLRMNPNINASSSLTYINNLKVQKVGNKQTQQVKNLPENAKIAYLGFSPDEKKMSFTHTTDKGLELWVLDLETATAKRLSSNLLNANFGMPYTWSSDGSFLLVRTLVTNRPALQSEAKSVPKGPIVSVGTGQVSQNRTYQDLLKNKIDEFNFEVLVTSELKKIDLNGKESLFKGAGMYLSESFSPDGNYLMITELKKPFSYIVPFNRFPRESKVYDVQGKEVALVNSLPLIENMPKGFSSTHKGKRSMSWRSDKPHTLFFVEALDGGDQNQKAEFRDEVFQWEAPFNQSPVSLIKLKQRFNSIIWGDEENTLVYELWYDTRNQKAILLNLKNNTQKVIIDRNYQDVYNDPGSPQTIKNQWNRYVLQIQNGKTYWLGAGHTKEGQFPFLDELDLKTLKKNRLYTSKLKNQKENIIEVLDIKKGDMLVSLQSATDYPNYFVKNYKKGKTTQLTFFKNPFESLKGIHKEVINYTRKDGVALSGTLYLPKNYDFKKKEKLPLLIWAYPREYKSKNTAGQSTANPNEFTYPYYGSFIYWVTKGYAVLDDAAFPIVGEDKQEPNDTFIEQLVANGEAAIDALDKLGYIDRKRVAVGGHSYGAFMTANLLTHSDLFVCGIARSGAYNRTLTPFGFQSEQRNYWDAPEVYNTMSPFMNAHKMKKPLLLIHGAADNNAGTFTFQTERYFQALKNLGAPVRMVLLPLESHGYQAKESILHTLWEQDQFLEKHLKAKK